MNKRTHSTPYTATMNTAYPHRFAAFTPVLEALKKTTPQFIAANIAALITTYLATWGINALLAPFNSVPISWIGLFLSLAAATTAFTITTSHALDRAENLDTSYLNALQNIRASVPVTIYITINTVLLLITTLFLFGPGSFVPIALLLLWPFPLIIANLTDRSDEPFSAIKDALTTSITHPNLNIPSFVTIIAIGAATVILFNYATPLLFPFLLYAQPFTIMLIATHYTHVNNQLN